MKQFIKPAIVVALGIFFVYLIVHQWLSGTNGQLEGAATIDSGKCNTKGCKSALDEYDAKSWDVPDSWWDEGQGCHGCDENGEPLVDKGTSDKGTSDKGTSDKGTSDKGTSDKGTSDKGTSDKGTSDKGTSDKGTSDKGTSGKVTIVPKVADEIIALKYSP